MAILYPEAASPITQGEQKVLSTLRDKLSDAWHVFYEPLIHETKPDFVLYSPYYGVLILEVKDYKSSTIQKLSPDTWTITTAGIVKQVTSPLKQVRNYAHELIRGLESSEVFINRTGVFQGRLKFPVHYACWFVNLSLDDVSEIGIFEVIPNQWMFTADDLKDSTLESRFTEILNSKFTIDPLNNDVGRSIKAYLYPELVPSALSVRQQIWFDNFKKNIKIFADFVDEILFVATEIRHLHTKDIQLYHIFIYYFQNRTLKFGTVAELIGNILMSMGISSSLNYQDKGDVCILPFEGLMDPSPLDHIFIVGCSFDSLTEEKELSLKLIFRESPQNIYITSSDLS